MDHNNKEPLIMDESIYQQQNDYEKFLCDNIENLYKEPAFKCKNNLLPDDDIQIIDIPKRFETIELSKPELEAEIDLHVNECLRSYNSNYLYLVKNYDKYTIPNLIMQKKRDYKKILANSEYQEYEIDQINLNKKDDLTLKSSTSSLLNTGTTLNFECLESDNLHPTIFERKTIDTIEKENETLRQLTTKRLKQLFNYYPLKGDDLDDENSDEILIEYRHEFEAPNELNLKTCSFICKCTQLKFELDCEPIFAQLALYDLKSRKKISENFYFDLNSEHIKYMLRAHQQYNQQDASTLSQACLFNLTYPNEDIYLVIRLEKVLQQGDINDCIEPYIKISQIQNYNEKQNYKEKFHLNAIQFCERLGKYRMPFAWTAINLINILNINLDNDSLNNENEFITAKSSSLDRKFNEKNIKAATGGSSSTAGGGVLNSNRDDSVINTRLYDQGGQQFQRQQSSIEQLLEKHLNNFKPVSISINSFFKQDADRLSDADLFKYLGELKKSTQSSVIKKLKCINGVLKMEFAPFNKFLYQQTQQSPTPQAPILNMNNFYFVNSTLQKLKYNRIEPPSSLNNTQSPQQVYIIKDLLEFPSREIYIPNYTYRNLLYIYPLEINLNNRVNTTNTNNLLNTTQQSTNLNNLNTTNLASSLVGINCSARNIVIRVNFMKDEHENYALPLIFGKSSAREFTKDFYSNVLYHNKTPQYYDEIKFKLPAILTDSNYHLLFTFSHVSCNSQKYDDNNFMSTNGSSSQLNQMNTNSSASSSQIETLIGYSWLPLLQQNDRQRVLCSGIYTLPIIFTDKLQYGYTLNQNQYICTPLTTTNSTNLISDTDQLKSYFQLRLNLQSTIHTQDAYLDRFINISNNILMNDYIYLNEQQRNSLRNYENIEQILKQSLVDLHLGQNESLVKFIFILLDKLFNIMMIFNTNVSQLCLSAINKICIKITNLLINENDAHMRNKYLVQYIRYTCNLPYKTIIQQTSNCKNQRLFHEELTLQLIKMLKCLQGTVDDELILLNLWFFLELLFKSMCFYVLIINTNETNSLNYKTKTSPTSAATTTPTQQIFDNKYHKKFTKFFLDNLIYLVKLLIKEILHKNFNVNNKNYKLTSKLNINLAFFLYDCFSILDRVFIFQLVQFYLKEINIKTKKFQNIIGTRVNLSYDLKHLFTLKLDFLRILCSHEHFITLNQPINSSQMLYDSNKSSLLTQCTFFFDQPPQHQHQHLFQNQTSSNQQQQHLKITTTFFKRYYLIGLLLKNFYAIFNNKNKISINSSGFTIMHIKLINLLRNLFESHDYDDRYVNMRSKIAALYVPFLMIILNYISNIYETKKQQQQVDSFLNENVHLKNLLICVLWLFKNFDKNFLLMKMIKYFNYDKLNKLLQMLDLCLVYFEYKNTTIGFNGSDRGSLADDLNRKFNRINFKLKLEDLIVGTQNARTEFIKRSKKLNQIEIENEIGDEMVEDDNYDENEDDGGDEFIGAEMDNNDDNDGYGDDFDEDDDDVLIEDDDDDIDHNGVIIDGQIDDFDVDVNDYHIDETNMTMMSLNQTSSASAVATNATLISSNTTTASLPTLQKQPTLRWRKDQLKFRLFNSTSSTSNAASISVSAISTVSKINDKQQQQQQIQYQQQQQQIEQLYSTESYLNLKSNLSTECTLIVLDTIDILIKYIQQIQQKRISISSNGTSTSISTSTLSIDSIIQANYLLLLTNIFKLILNSLSLNQSVNALKNLFSQQRILIYKYPELIFDSLFLNQNNKAQAQLINNYKNENNLCADLCTCLLKYCISRNTQVRSEASTSIYTLLKQNYDISNNFTRIKISITILFNNLINTLINNYQANELVQNEYFLKKSLRTIYAYTDYDVDFSDNLSLHQIKELVLNLNTILTSIIRIKLTKLIDNEMLIDLMYRIANCYTNTPNLRLIWLQNMAQKHLQFGNLVEAGHCLIHASALIAEYLSIIENKSYLPIGCTNFKQATVNVLEESAIYDDILFSPFNFEFDYIQPQQPQQQQQQQQGNNSNNLQYSGKYFTENGLINLIEQAAVFLIHSQHYEVANQLYKLLIPIYEFYRDYKKLAQIHSKLNDCFNKIMLHGSKRLFGTYFRVGFYGKLFEELDGEEFVYKEPGITKLSEIANRLEAFYNEKFSPDVVEIMKDSNNVDRRTLQENKAYIQITYVEPFFDRWELLKCVTHFEKNYSLKRFIYSTPFTLDGKAHGTLKEQYKRKTILTTERAFPYVKTRISVIDKQQIVLSPVEVAIEDIQKKIDELRQAIFQEPADPKILQMVLQGCVGTTVNQGPLEMALAFLQPNSNELFTEHHNKLRICFKEFTRRCAEALEKNKTLIGPDQYEYQQEMERNHRELKAKIDPLIEARPFTFS